MIRTLPNPQILNRSPNVPQNIRELPKWGADFNKWSSQFLSQLQNVLSGITDVVNTGSQGAGDDLVAATAITPTAYFHRVSGTGTIQTINTPLGGSGALVLESMNGFSLAPGGNILLPRTITIAVDFYAQLVYQAVFSLWYVDVGAGAVQPGDFVDYEIPAGTINGTNPTFTIAKTPPSKFIQLVKNGVVMEPEGQDYTLSGKTITYVSAQIPGTSDGATDRHWCSYRTV